MKYFKRNELLDILEKMKVLDIIMQSKEDDIRILNPERDVEEALEEIGEGE